MMKALILNSGIGKRMGELTADKPKCMVEVVNDTTVLDMQISLILEANIPEIVITTGPFADVLQKHIETKFPQAKVTYVHNPIYDKTNYIYSIALAKEELNDDIILMHGDLVFEKSVFDDIINSETSAMVIDTTLPLPEKDFKAVVDGEKITKVGLEFFDNSYAAQPLYKLKKSDWLCWLDKILEFCDNGNNSVYAENAFNEVSNNMNVKWFDVNGRICSEIDTAEDLKNMRNLFTKKENN